DCGSIAVSLPNGTLLACTFSEELNEELFAMQGLELRKNRIDTLLGPGLNIHRNPMNGRNFEYFSEDPLLTGKMAAAQLRGMHRWGTTGTVKHFACNNQEFHRTDIDSIVSERALREIYLPAFKMAVKEGGAYFVMSTYGALNGLWTASNYDLLSTVLRGEWGFDGAVMTDWWAKGSDEGEAGTRENVAAQVRAQNDLNMVNADSASNSQGDNMPEAIKDGRLSREALVRAAKNICVSIMKSPVMERSLGRVSDEERAAAEAEAASGDLPPATSKIVDRRRRTARPRKARHRKGRVYRVRHPLHEERQVQALDACEGRRRRSGADPDVDLHRRHAARHDYDQRHER
ncbi:MAG: glycoside hydrolase family 3 protein, partial [Acutalibacteraceae bacterium]